MLVGVNTVNRDNPQLNVRLIPSTRQPLRVVLDPNGRVDSNAQMIHDGGKTLLMQQNFTGLSSLMHQLADQEIQRVLVEGGPTTVHRFIEAGLVDELFLVHSDAVHASPVPSGIASEVLVSAGLTLAHEYVWGDERVEHYLRSA